jgi:prolyl oligopeptidase
MKPPTLVNLTAIAILSSLALARPPYPPTEIRPVVETLHGADVSDPYRWLENGADPEVQKWTAAQNELTRAYLDRFKPERKRLRDELERLHSAATINTPRIFGTKFFYARREPGENHASIWLRDGGMAAEPRRLINPNAFSNDGTAALDWWFPSPDGDLIAYGRSDSGSEESTLYLYDVRAGADTALKIPRTRAGDVAWEKSRRGFTYVQYPAAGEVPPGEELVTRWVKHHRFGTPLDSDPIVFGKDQSARQWHSVSNSCDDEFQFLFASTDWAINDLYFRPNDPAAEFKPLAVGYKAQFHAEAYKGVIYLRTNYEAERFRILAIDATDSRPVESLSSPSAWKELVPQQTGVIEGLTIVADELVIRVLEDVRTRLLRFGLDGQPRGEIALPEAGHVDAVAGRPGGERAWFVFESFTHPPTLFEFTLESGDLKPLERMAVDVAPDRYKTEQVWFASKDGTRVPMWIIRRADVKPDGDNPTVLYGYGGFENSLTPRFNAELLPWLDRRGVYAVANLRGGGEFGAAWHAAGRLQNKQNVFDDMIAAAEKLIADGWTQPARLGCAGRSNGGLLVAAMTAQRPDLFAAVYCGVPLTDMLRYERFLIGSLWSPEYGSAGDAAAFEWLRAWSPYHNLKDGTPYPAVLIPTAESDTRVDPCHARKFAARLQAASSSENPVLLWVETKAGHGAGKPLSKKLDDAVDRWTFFLWRLGVLQE